MLCTTVFMCCGGLNIHYSVCSVVNACIHRCVNDNQLQTVNLLQECIMMRDGMAHRPDAFTVDDILDIRFKCSVLSVFLVVICVSCKLSVYVLIFLSTLSFLYFVYDFIYMYNNNNNNNNNNNTKIYFFFFWARWLPPSLFTSTSSKTCVSSFTGHHPFFNQQQTLDGRDSSSTNWKEFTTSKPHLSVCLRPS